MFNTVNVQHHEDDVTKDCHENDICHEKKTIIKGMSINLRIC